MFLRYMGKLLSDPSVLFLVMAAIFFENPFLSSKQDTQKNIYTKFGSYWSSSVGGEKLWKLLMMTDDNDGCQVMAIAQKKYHTGHSYL